MPYDPEEWSVVVYHRGFGCETGCCGHAIRYSYEEPWHDLEFAFDHPDYGSTTDQKIEWAKNLVTKAVGEDHAADLDWDNCMVVDIMECPN